MNCLTRKLADITNDNNASNSSSHALAKCQRVHHDSPSADSDDEDVDAGTHVSEQFVYQAGHRFFLICAPWIYSGDNLFDLDVLMRTMMLLIGSRMMKIRPRVSSVRLSTSFKKKFQVQSLCKRWLRQQVSYIHILHHCTYSLIVCEQAFGSTFASRRGAFATFMFATFK